MNDFRFFILSALLVLSSPTYADVIDVGDVSFGGNTYRAFQDDTTSLIWLDLDNFWDGTTTYNSLTALLVGSGFHLATLAELEQLYLSMPAVPANFDAEVIIVGGNNGSRDLMWGIYEDGNSADGVSYSFRYDNYTDWVYGPNVIGASEVFSINNPEHNDLGAWIVEGEAPSATPVPSLRWQGVTLLIILLAGFTYYFRKKVVA